MRQPPQGRERRLILDGQQRLTTLECTAVDPDRRPSFDEVESSLTAGAARVEALVRVVPAGALGAAWPDAALHPRAVESVEAWGVTVRVG